MLSSELYLSSSIFHEMIQVTTPQSIATTRAHSLIRDTRARDTLLCIPLPELSFYSSKTIYEACYVLGDSFGKYCWAKRRNLFRNII